MEITIGTLDSLTNRVSACSSSPPHVTVLHDQRPHHTIFFALFSFARYGALNACLCLRWWYRWLDDSPDDVTFFVYLLFVYIPLSKYAPLMPPPVRTNFVVFPPGCGDSAADFWGWDAHEAQLRCPNDVSGDMYMKMRCQDGPLSLNLLTTQTMVTMRIFPYQEKFPW